MTKLTFLMFTLISLTLAISAQNSNSNTTSKPETSGSNSNTNSNQSKRAPVFRANKDQISQAQTMLKQKGFYTGEATGKLDDPTRDALRKLQESEKIRATGTLNRITLEKMGIALTDAQKLIPVSESSIKPGGSSEGKTRNPVFRATKDQITQAQKILKGKSLYSGADDGKINDDLRSALRKYQEMEKIKVTGTLNRETLEKMGIQLTDSQKALKTSASKTS